MSCYTLRRPGPTRSSTSPPGCSRISSVLCGSTERQVAVSRAANSSSGSSQVSIVVSRGGIFAISSNSKIIRRLDFWSPDQRRYTVFFDPGRVKTDLVPNTELGRALVPGRTYSIVIGREWPDGFGRPLLEEYRKTVTIDPPVDHALRLAEWTLSNPAAGSRDPLIVTLPRPLDHALLGRTVGVEYNGAVVDGDVTIARYETEWHFVPAEPWQSAEYRLVALAELEDPSGNLIDQAFEVDPTQATAAAPRPDRYRVPFTPR